MNIQLQFGGVLLLILLLYFYKRQGNLGLYINKLFLHTLCVSLICLLLDILSIFLIVNQDTFPLWIVRGECKLYLVSLVFTGYMALIYSNADIRNLAGIDHFSMLVTIFAALSGIVILILPIRIHFGGPYDLYTFGPACLATYAAAILLIFLTLFNLSFKGKRMNPKRRSAVAIWMAIWMTAAVIQFINSNMLMVGYASALGMVILFFELENPEIYADRATGLFNNYAFEEYIDQKYRLNKNCGGIVISLDTIHEKNISAAAADNALPDIVQYLQQIQHAKIFKTDKREFTLLFEDEKVLMQASLDIHNRFDKEWSCGENNAPIILQPDYLIIPSMCIAKDADEMFGLIKFNRLRFAENPDACTLVLDGHSLSQKRRREEMLETIQLAIKEDRVEVFFQPIYSAVKRKFVSAEALARIRLDDGSILAPGLFIPIAEETGLIAKIGEIVFEKTCRLLKEHDVTKYGLEYIEVNLSVVQCENEMLAEIYKKIMERYELPPQYINLEITESAAILKKNVLLGNMQALIDYGVSFSLDDFGNGQSNLNYIVDMPVRIVKFDRDMTTAYFETPKAQFVVQAAINMIHEMELKVVSEGVETAEQLAVLEKLGIDYFQGYYFSKPVEADRFIDFIKTQNAAAAMSGYFSSAYFTASQRDAVFIYASL